MKGKTGFETLTMEGVAVCRRGAALFAELIAGIDRSIAADADNDPNLMEGLKLLKAGIEVCQDNKLKQLLIRAHAEFRVAADKDFSDTTKEVLKAHILPWTDKFPELAGEFQELQTKVGE